MKRKLVSQHSFEVDEQPLCFRPKQLRSQLTRRRRVHIPPVVEFSGEDSYVAAVSEVSGDSSIASVSNLNPPEIGERFGRIITRSYYRKHFKDVKRNHDEAVELSETSCVESCSGTNRGLNLKSPNVEELEVEGGDAAKSEVSSASRFSFSENNAKVREPESSVGTTKSEVVLDIQRVNEICRKEITDFEAEKKNSAQNDDVLVQLEDSATKISENSTDFEEIRPPNLVALDFDLACSEQFSNGGVTIGGEDVDEEEEHNSSSSGIVHVISDSELDSSDYSQSIWSYDSGSQFSEKSSGENFSPTFQLFRQFKQQFYRSTYVLQACEDHSSDQINKLGLQDEDEESFRMMMMRERRQEYVHDYADEYCNYTAYGDLVIQQRLQMVQWIVEQATNTELQPETMFLGVNLLDRFLSKGYFKNARHLQIAGIACLTLATRIEENQPYNCVRKKSFYVGSMIYARCEVVAMEWLVQEVLNFQCLLPTLYNFLCFYLKAPRANENVEKTAKYLAVLTLMGHQQLCFWPSTVAAGLVIISSIATNQDASSDPATEFHSRHNDKDLPECIKSMEWLVKYL